MYNGSLLWLKKWLKKKDREKLLDAFALLISPKSNRSGGGWCGVLMLQGDI